MKKIVLITLIFVVAICTYNIAFASETDENATMVIAEQPEGFYDISEDHYAYTSAKNLYSKGYISADKDGRINPENGMSREQAVDLALAINKVETEKGLTVDAPDFEKVSDWAKDVVATAHKYGVIRGDENNNLMPTDNITRAELVAVAMRALNVQISGVNVDFADVPKDSWYYDYIGCAKELGIISATPDNSFKPDNEITKADSFVIFDRVLTLRTALENAAVQ